MPLSPTREDFQQIARGLLMGGADIIPGVSGGTVALILGIYERLVVAISHVDGRLLVLVGKREWTAAAKHLDLRFLLTLAFGIGLGIISLASLMHELLTHYHAYTLASFFGMILASSLLVGRMIGAHSRATWITAIACVFAGAAFALWITTRPAYAAQSGPAYTFASGMVAICAMILPGISGSYILLLLGKYAEITGIIKQLPRLECSLQDLTTLAIFAAGCAVGLVLFSKVLRWLLARCHAPTMATLCGFMLGSLVKIWPFQIDTTPTATELKHKIYEITWPQEINREVILCTAIALGTLGLVLAIDRIARRGHEDASGAHTRG